MSFGVRFDLDDFLPAKRESRMCPVSGPTMVPSSDGLIAVYFAPGELVPCFRCHAAVPADDAGKLPQHSAGSGEVTDEYLAAVAKARRTARNRARA